jgi:hypothetical protein
MIRNRLNIIECNAIFECAAEARIESDDWNEVANIVNAKLKLNLNARQVRRAYNRALKNMSSAEGLEEAYLAHIEALDWVMIESRDAWEKSKSKRTAKLIKKAPSTKDKDFKQSQTLVTTQSEATKVEGAGDPQFLRMYLEASKEKAMAFGVGALIEDIENDDQNSNETGVIVLPENGR